MAFAIGLSLSAPAAHALTLPFDDYSLPVNDNPQGLNANDCSGDGILDLISANFDSNTATIFENSGPGTLLHDANIATAAQPSGAACADFNNDGRIDAAVTSWKDKTVTLYLRQEDGTFVVGSVSPVGNLPRSVSAADLNLDHNMDLVVVNVQSSDLTLLFGNGSGGFSAVGNIRIPRLSPQASRPVSAQIADFNGDNLPDIIVAANQKDPSLHLLLGDGFGFHFSTAPLPGCDRLLYVAAGDINGDRIPDIATLGVDASIKLYAGLGNGTFSPLTTLLAGPQAKAIALADFDGDGLTDLAVSYSDSNSVQILRAVSPGIFRTPYNIATATVVNPMASARVRVTATGSNQIVFVDGPGHRLSMLQLLDLTGPSVTPLAGLTGVPDSLLLTDMTNDGIPDSVVPTLGPKKMLGVTVLKGTSGGGFELPPTTPVNCGNLVLEAGESCDDGNTKKGDGCSATCTVEAVKTIYSIDAADFNGDGSKDLAIVDSRGDLKLYVGNGFGQFPAILKLAKVKRKTGAAVGDFNGDGLPDLAIVPSKRKGGSVTLLLNDGLGNFTPLPVLAPAKLTGPLIAGDFDRNGFDDLLAVQTSKPKGVMLLMSDAAGPLRSFQTTPTPAGITSLAAADFDENGYLDMLAEFKGKKQAPLLMLGTLGGRFMPAAAIPPGPARFAIADVDEDLHQDLISCTDATSPTCRILYGTGFGSFAGAPLPVAPSIGRDVRGAAADDFDKDGFVDLAGVSRQDSRLVVHFGGPNPSSIGLETGQLPEALAIADLNDDGFQDLLVANAGSQDISIFINQGGRQFVTLARTKLPNGTGHVSIAVGDVDGDKKKDLVVTQSESNRLTIFRNTGGAGFAVLGNPLVTPKEPRGVALGRLNSDDVADVVTANRGANSVSVFLSQPDGTYSRTDVPSQGFSPWDVVLPDLDGDTFDDLVVLNEFDMVPVPTKTPTPTPTVTPTPANGPTSTSGATATKTVTPTPTATAVVPTATPTPFTDSQEGNVITFLNDGSGGFPAVTERHTRGRQTPIAMCVGDFNGDTALDIAVASVTSSDVMVLHGAGDGHWSSDERDFPVGNPVGGLSCHDADGDDRTDIAFARRRSNDVGVILTKSN
jgi:cysteine-rich repeat protein